MSQLFHTHTWRETWRHDNKNRLRVKEECACGASRYGCKAKRLSETPDEEGNREAWGPVDGKMHYGEESSRG